ncbi:nucleoside-diphosphate kinase [Candidatus Nomurabacteria bacterium]|nr:nucleoside-diphosphate kinase [Candidatus Nomurabacteria bacterium]
MSALQQTLVVLKPDAVQRGINGEIISRFEKAGLKIVGMKMVSPDEKHFHEHYEGISQLITRWGKDIYNVTLSQMTEGPVIAIVLEGIEAVKHVRKMVGATDPLESPPGTIRGDFTHLSRAYTNERNGTLPNVVHASGDPDEAKKEIALWFQPEEIYQYKNVHEEVLRGRVPKTPES